MRIALIVKMFREEDSTLGVFRKYQDIQNAFIKLNHSCDLFYPSETGIMCNDKVVQRRANKNGLYRRITQIFFESYLIKNIDLAQYDIILLRYHLSAPWLIRSLRQIRKRNSSIKILIEIPTYPYDKEHRGITGFIRKTVDKASRGHLKTCVDFILTYSNHGEIFSIPCLNIMNGIDCNRYSISKQDKLETEINLIAIGNLWEWYGIDRAIEGLKLYYQSDPEKKVKLVIIGEGKERVSLEKLTIQYDLERYIQFIGALNEGDCDEYFDKSQLGIGTLAAHRKDLEEICSIKHREYASRGIPFIYAGVDKAFTHISSTKSIEANDQPLDIQSIIDFYETIPDNSSEGLRSYACKELSWVKQASKIIGACTLN